MDTFLHLEHTHILANNKFPNVWEPLLFQPNGKKGSGEVLT
jgi:hypothetical protein